MLIQYEQIASQLSNDKPQVELPDNTHRGEVLSKKNNRRDEVSEMRKFLMLPSLHVLG